MSIGVAILDWCFLNNNYTQIYGTIDIYIYMCVCVCVYVCVCHCEYISGNWIEKKIYFAFYLECDYPSMPLKQRWFN